MVTLRQDSRGNYSARKRIPEDVREEYGRLYRARFEAKFSAPASVGLQEAQRRFREWEAKVAGNIDTIRRTQRGEGIDLNHKEAHALAGEWYNWFVARHEEQPGEPEQWDIAFWHLVDAMAEALPDDVQSEELERNQHLLAEWAAYPEVRAAMRPIISDFGHTAQFLAGKRLALTNAARDQFLDAVLQKVMPALTLLERRAKGNYEPDELPKSFPPPFTQRRDQGKSRGSTPSELFEAWVQARHPSHSTVESWRTVFNALTRDFTERSSASITHEEAQDWIDRLVTKERSARTVRNTWLRATRTVYKWGVRRRTLTNNPFADVVVDVPRRKQHRPKYFYEHECLTILKAASAVRDTNNPDRAARRWVPWLLAYTGARPGEITQLRGSDVERIEGIWIVHLTPEAGTIKSGIARRVPIHFHLAEQGFLEFVQHVGKGPLFYRERKRREHTADLLNQRKSPGAQVRQRLAAWVREIGVKDKHLSPNHAWRHHFKHIGRRFEPNDTLLDYICGHAPATVGRSYGEPALKDMARVIKRFPRYEIDDKTGCHG
jgi:integrase